MLKTVQKIDVPAFSAFQAVSQSITSGVYSKVTFDTEEFDTNSSFSTVLSRFQPNVAGYYQVNSQVAFNALTSTTNIIGLFKNGSEYKRGNRMQASGNNTYLVLSSLVYMNGSTDYLEIFTFQNSAGAVSLEVSGALIANVNTYFNGSFVRMP
jgi:hypothetical protein